MLKGPVGSVVDQVKKQVVNVKTQIQSKVAEVKQQLRQMLQSQQQNFALAGGDVRHIEDTGTVGRNTPTPSPKPSNTQPSQNGSNKKPAEDKGTGKGVPKPVSIDEAKGIARTKIAQERNELLEGKYIDPNTGDIYIPHVMTAAVNLKTGRAYIGYNGKGVDFRTGNERFNPTVSELDDEVVMLVEKTKNRALEASKQAGGEVKDSFEKWTVDNCAEVQAVNQAVKDGAKVEDILLSTIEVLPNKYKKVCKNCKETFENFFIDNFK
ncbi:hypothetical protein JD967_21460 [Lysinibacillus fusiformis]|nr:hypothetical protein [Lysinibacillus fusiformis]